VTGTTEFDMEMTKELTEFEQYLLESQHLIKTRGKVDTCIIYL